MNLTLQELKEAQSDITKGLNFPVSINGVSFHKFLPDAISFNYANASGLIFPDNGYNGHTKDKKDYYLLWKLSCRFSDNLRFNPSFAPNLNTASSVIIASWNLFIKG